MKTWPRLARNMYVANGQVIPPVSCPFTEEAIDVIRCRRKMRNSQSVTPTLQLLGARGTRGPDAMTLFAEAAMQMMFRRSPSESSLAPSTGSNSWSAALSNSPAAMGLLQIEDGRNGPATEVIADASSPADKEDTSKADSDGAHDDQGLTAATPAEIAALKIFKALESREKGKNGGAAMCKKPSAAVGKNDGAAVCKRPAAAVVAKTISKKDKAKASPGRRIDKPKAWLRERPQGCGRCRQTPGCSASCWAQRGGAPK
jgi:hypothetical protein